MIALVCGKGGSGKSTLVVLLSRELADIAGRVVVIDADESNVNLPRMMGVRESLRISKLVERKEMFELSDDNWRKIIEKLPMSSGVNLISIGKVTRSGEGCACPYGAALRGLLRNLKELVLVDAEAGVEHLGRGVDELVDVIVLVADPTPDSVEICRRMRDFSAERGKRFILIVNRVPPYLGDISSLFFGCTEPFAVIREDREIMLSIFKGGPVRCSSETREAIRRLAEAIINP